MPDIFLYRFSHLMNKHAERLLVPTLDIDLVWHTHQLMPTKYAVDCTNYIGHFVDQQVYHSISIRIDVTNGIIVSVTIK